MRALGLTVLIVDDNAVFRAAARSVLEADGFVVIGESATGSDGVSATVRLRPDVVLLDVQLPDLHGFEVADRISAAGIDVAVVLISSRDRAGYDEQVERSPARGFLDKADLSGETLARLVA